MKNFNKSFNILFVMLFAMAFVSCKKCKNEDPSARIVNNGSTKASVQIQTSNGNTVNINNILPGTSSDYASYAAGDIKFTISIGTVDVVENVSMYECYNYDILIDGANNVTTVSYDLNE